jgi:ubiquinone/menaquinone biosynthesis C-methylase UbiE
MGIEKFIPNLFLGNRDRVAKQLRKLRSGEYNNIHGGEFYERNRSFSEYKKELLGINSSLTYANDLAEKDLGHIVLDIGAGTTRAVSEIRDSYKGIFPKLTFQSTTLVADKKITEYIGLENNHITSGEFLRGVKDNSVALAISVYSLTYSKSPEMIAESLKRVLCPGGIAKIAFLYGDGKFARISSIKSFRKEFIRVGLEVCSFQEDSGILLVRKINTNLNSTEMQSLQGLLIEDEKSI